jgi:hypothetical protein
MAEEYIDIAILVAKRALKGPWASHAWEPASVLIDAPQLEPMTPLGVDGSAELFFLGRTALLMHSAETAHYLDNLRSGRPAIWVAIQVDENDKPQLMLATLDPYEGEAASSGNGEILEALPMPEVIQARLNFFCEAHHIERTFIKRKRDKTGGHRRSGEH